MTQTQTLTHHDKREMLDALRSHISQRSGMDWRDYGGDHAAYMSYYRPMLQAGKDAREMLRYVMLNDEITPEQMLDACSAFSGRLQLVHKDGAWTCEYVTGQYFPTEYRAAACAVLARCIFDRWHKDATQDIQGRARRMLGRGIARRWFN
jgi:hypothetical protein